MPSYPGASIFRIDLNNVVAGVDLLSAPAFLSRTPGYWALTVEQKKNPYTNEIFTDTRDFQLAMARAE